MIQIILNGDLPPGPWLRGRCLSDPEMLSRLAERASGVDAATSDVSDRFSRILDDLRMAGVWKRTSRRRLPQTENMLCKYVSRQWRAELRFLDIGASDGVTTVDAVRALRRNFDEDVLAYAADINLWLLRYRLGPLIEYRATDGEPIMVRLGPLGVRLAKSRRGAAQPDANPIARFYLRRERFRGAMRSSGRISLVNPLTTSEPGISVIEFDCLRRDKRFLGCMSAVRASNVLNPGYFLPSQITEAVGHLHAYLHEAGCLVISRNTEDPSGEIENGSVWIKERQRFRRVADFGTGSEIGRLVDDWALPNGKKSFVRGEAGL